jgi:hypothetical protein
VSKPPEARRKPEASAKATTLTKELKATRFWVHTIISHINLIKGNPFLFPLLNAYFDQKAIPD